MENEGFNAEVKYTISLICESKNQKLFLKEKEFIMLSKP